MSHHLQQVRTTLVFVLADPSKVDKFTGLDGFVIRKLDQGQLSSYLDGLIGEKLRPVILRVLDVILELRRRSVKVKVDLLAALVIIESPLDNFTD